MVSGDCRSLSVDFDLERETRRESDGDRERDRLRRRSRLLLRLLRRSLERIFKKTRVTTVTFSQRAWRWAEIRPRLHDAGTKWIRYEWIPDWPCVYTIPAWKSFEYGTKWIRYAGWIDLNTASCKHPNTVRFHTACNRERFDSFIWISFWFIHFDSLIRTRVYFVPASCTRGLRPYHILLTFSIYLYDLFDHNHDPYLGLFLGLFLGLYLCSYLVCDP